MLLVSRQFSVPKPLSQIQRSTLWLLQGLSPKSSFGGFGLRGTPEDFDNWSQRGNNEWAFTQVLPYFRKLETDQDFRGDFHGSDGPIPVRRVAREEMLPHAQALYEACLAEGFPDFPDHNHPGSTGIASVPINNLDGVRVSTALAYLDQARHCLNLTLRANVTVTRVLFKGNRAVGVEGNSGGERFTVEGEQIVLSAGAIASPHLLLLSGVGRAEHLRSLGIDVVQDLPGVGQNLRDHPYVMIYFREKGTAPDYFRQPCVNAVLRYTSAGSLARNDMQIGHIPLDSAHLPNGVPIAREDTCFCLYRGSNAALHSSGELKLTSRDPQTYSRLWTTAIFSEPWDLRAHAARAIRLAIRLSEHPRLQRHYCGTDIGLTDDGPRFGCGPGRSWIMRNVGLGGIHSSGTCKIGPESDPMAVVDQFCHVYGLEGLRVVDASVMPECDQRPTPTLPLS